MKSYSSFSPGNVDFGATFIYPNPQELKSLTDVDLVPVALFAIVPAYNVSNRFSTIYNQNTN